MKKLKIECLVSDDTYAKIKASQYLMRYNGAEFATLLDILAQVENERYDTENNTTDYPDAYKWNMYVAWIKAGLERQIQNEVRERESGEWLSKIGSNRKR